MNPHAPALLREAQDAYVYSIDGNAIKPPSFVFLGGRPREFQVPPGSREIVICDYHASGKPFNLKTMHVQLQPGRSYSLGTQVPVLVDTADDSTAATTEWIKYR